MSNCAATSSRVVVFMVLALFSAACGSSGNGQGSSSQGSGETETSAAPDNTAADTTQQPSGDTSRQDLRVGDTATFRYGDTTTVYSYTYPAQPSTDIWVPTPGTDYATLDVEGCAGPVEITRPDDNTLMSFNGLLFALQMPDYTPIPPTVPAVEPVLPAVNLPAGECVRGNVTFEVPQGQIPSYAVQEPATPPARWAIEYRAGRPTQDAA